MKKLLLLGSVVSACPPLKQGGIEWVAYYQAKQLAKRGLEILFIGAPGTQKNFHQQITQENPIECSDIIKRIEFIEIGGGTQFGNAADALQFDLSQIEASRQLRIEVANLAHVAKIMVDKRQEYDVILNNMRAEAAFIPVADLLKKKFITVLHLNLHKELASLLEAYNTPIISISHEQRIDFPDLNYIANIYNSVNLQTLLFNDKPKNYALMLSTIGRHKNQKDAILAAKQADIQLILGGKIRDVDYFEQEIAPHIDGKKIQYLKEVDKEKKIELYRNAKVFLFPVRWQEPFGLVAIEALACGTPVIAYPHGGPKETIKNGINGYLVHNPQEMAEKIKEINSINRATCRYDVETRFSENIIGEQYFNLIKDQS